MSWPLLSRVERYAHVTKTHPPWLVLNEHRSKIRPSVDAMWRPRWRHPAVMYVVVGDRRVDVDCRTEPVRQSAVCIRPSRSGSTSLGPVTRCQNEFDRSFSSPVVFTITFDIFYSFVSNRNCTLFCTDNPHASSIRTQPPCDAFNRLHV